MKTAVDTTPWDGNPWEPYLFQENDVGVMTVVVAQWTTDRVKLIVRLQVSLVEPSSLEGP